MGIFSSRKLCYSPPNSESRIGATKVTFTEGLGLFDCDIKKSNLGAQFLGDQFFLGAQFFLLIAVCNILLLEYYKNLSWLSLQEASSAHPTRLLQNWALTRKYHSAVRWSGLISFIVLIGLM
jgi:hypothetical protein